MIKTPVVLMVLVGVLATPSFADTPVTVDLTASIASCDYVGPEVVVMFNLPNGGGSTFSTASAGGQVVDATIRLTVMGTDGLPYVNYPLLEAVLESADAGLVHCYEGTTADVAADSAGQTYWNEPLHAGGYSQALTEVWCNESPLQSGPGLRISHNSADINGDLKVDLSDIAIFAGDFYGGLNPFRSDLVYDGVVNLSDIVRMSESMGSSCQ